MQYIHSSSKIMIHSSIGIIKHRDLVNVNVCHPKTGGIHLSPHILSDFTPSWHQHEQCTHRQVFVRYVWAVSGIKVHGLFSFIPHLCFWTLPYSWNFMWCWVSPYLFHTKCSGKNVQIHSPFSAFTVSIYINKNPFCIEWLLKWPRLISRKTVEHVLSSQNIY